MADELSTESPNIAETATSDLARGRILLEAQINKLMASLDKRKNQTFDPMLLRAAQGFLAPTKTGRFSESLGNVAGGVAEEQVKQQAQDEQADRMKLELSQKMYDLQKQTEAQRILGGSLGAKPTLAQAPTGAPMAPTAPVGGGVMPIPQAQAPQAPTQPTQGQADIQQAVSAIKQNPSIMDELTMTPQIVAQVSALDPALGKIAESVYNGQMKKAELMQKRYNTNAQGDVFDTFTGEMVKKGQRTIEVASPFDPDRTIKMPVEVAEQYNKLDFNNPNTVNSFLRSHGLGAYAIGAPSGGGEGGGDGTPTGGTKLERETAFKIKEKRAGANIDEDVKLKTSIGNAADAAIDIKNNASAVYNFASNPKTANAFGVLAKPGVASAVLSAAQEGIRVGPYNIGFGGVEDAVRKIGGTQADIDAASAAARNISQLELGFSQAFKGQGQVSDAERRIVKQVGPALSDSPKVVMLKSELITARATFDSENAARYQKWSEAHPEGFVNQYKQSPQYKELVQHYDNKLKQVENKYMAK